MSNCFIILSVCLLLLQKKSNSQIINKSKHLDLNVSAPISPLKTQDSTQSKILSTSLSLKQDSLPNKNFRLVNAVGLQSVNEFKSGITKSLSTYKTTVSEIKSAFKNPVQLKSGRTDYQGIADSSYINSNNSFSYLSNISFNSDWLIAGISTIVNVQSQSWSDVDRNRDLISVKFDKDNYLKNIQKKLNGKFDPASLLQLPVDAARRMADEAKNSLTNELKNLNDRYAGLLNTELTSFATLENLSTLDVKSLRQQFLTPDIIKAVSDKENLLGMLQQKMNTGGKVNPDEIAALQREVVKLKAVQEFIGKVAEHKQRWESSGLLKKLKESDLLQKEKIRQLVNDPATIRKMAKQLLSLKGAEKLFLNINRLDIGQNALSLSPMSFRSFLSNGVVTEFLNKGKSFLVMAGKQRDFNSILDYTFSSNLFSNSGFAKAARVELRKTKTYSSHVALSSFNQSLSNALTPFNAATFRQILVTTISNEFAIGQKGFFTFDLSRSASQYQRSSGPTDSTLDNKNPLSGILSGDNLLANTAISVKYADEFAASGLSYQVNFSKVANGYANPGNTFLSNGSAELGFNLRKTFLKNKIQLSVRANGREYSFGENDNRKWRSIYTTLDARWKMKKGQYVSLRYQPTRMTRVEESFKQVVTSVERLSFDANVQKKLKKTIYRNLVTVAYLRSSYIFSQSSIRNTSWTVNSFQNLSIGKNMLFINTAYNKAVNQTGFVYLNSSFVTETGFSYPLFGKIFMSSGLTYNSTEGWFKQLGVRQSISGQLGDKFSVSVFLDARKNLSLYQPLWSQPVRADVALRYIFGNNQ